MRVSTHQTYQRGVKPITDHQSNLAKVQEQISSGRKILKPADDPTNSARLMLSLIHISEPTRPY